LVIFVTAHAMHALRAFELEALDYLTKPVRRERLQAALARAAQRLSERAAVQNVPPGTEGERAAAPEPTDFITLTDRGRLLRIPVSEVLYFKAELKYLTLRTASESHVMDGALSDLEQRFGDRFLRVHRNALVARWAVRELERHAPTNFGELDGGDPNAEVADSWAVRVVHVDEWLAVSRRQVAAVREALAGQRG
jgi:two-component system response regulator AlgR